MVRILVRGGVWKNSEDEILKAAVMKYGKNHWARVASLLPRKTAKQCKARWHEWLDPSIKKTEWTRQEDEKLLHLAKLMPTQWRTIAPAVGRTAAQCLERYEKLLDMAQDGAETGNDARKLKIGEIDPSPETKPARPDPIDMDEDEKEMLSEARARLANTRGKKAKRRARERQLENSRRLASLQKFRELKASGISASLHKLGLKRKKGELDYNNEIPFEKPAPVGFYDVTAEREVGERVSVDPEERAKMLEKMNKNARESTIDEETVRKRAKKNFDKLAKDNLPEALKRINEANDPSNIRVRSKLELPSPHVSDTELQQIAEMDRPVHLSGSGQKSTQGLLGEYKRPGTLGMGAVTARTPAAPDTVMQEARNEVQRLKAQTPLLGGETRDLNQGTGFTGITPATHVPATPISISGQSITTRKASLPTHVEKQGMTPLRDELHLNKDVDDEFLDEAEQLSRSHRHQKKLDSEKLLQGFKRLPKPEDSYEILVKLQDEQFDEEGRITREFETDAEDIEAEKKRQHLAEEKAELKKRSSAVRRNLPRPVVLDTKLKHFEASETSSKEHLAMIKAELMNLLSYDHQQHPVQPLKKKSKFNSASFDMSKFVLYPYEEMEHARKFIAAELRQTKLAAQTDTYSEIWDEIYKDLGIITDAQGSFTVAKDKSSNDSMDMVKEEYYVLKDYLKAISKQVSKEENKAQLAIKDVVEQASKAQSKFYDTEQKIQEAQLKADVYDEIRAHEEVKLNERLHRAQEELENLVEVEQELQKQYAQVANRSPDAVVQSS